MTKPATEERVAHTPQKIQQIRERLQKVCATFGDSYNNPDAYDTAHADFVATAPEEMEFLLDERESLVDALRAAEQNLHSLLSDAYTMNGDSGFATCDRCSARFPLNEERNGISGNHEDDCPTGKGIVALRTCRAALSLATEGKA